MRTKPPVRRGRNKPKDPRQARCDDRRNSGCGISEVASDDRAFPEKSAAEVAQQIAPTTLGPGGTKTRLSFRSGRALVNLVKQGTFLAIAAHRLLRLWAEFPQP